MKTNVNYIDPADEDSLIGTFRFILGKALQNIEGLLPAKVIAFDRTDPGRVQVQPLITMITTDGSQVSRADVASVPVLQIGGGGYFLSFNLQVGDLGWLFASDRDISLFLQSYEESPPNTFRKFQFSDGIFIPTIMRNYTIAGEDAEHAVLQSTDGSVRIALWPDKVKITAPEGLEIDGPITVNGHALIDGDLRVEGDITASGDITPNVP